MRIRYISGMLMLCLASFIQAQEADSIRQLSISEVVIEAAQSRQQIRNKNSALPIDVVEQNFIRQHFTGNLMQTLGRIPGVHSMDIGSGFSKPMIRGMAFNRVLVTENGIKQEGQQWGADHGLEIDAFNAEEINIRKGPSSLLYGSDAMGGAIEIGQLPAPIDNQVFGEAVLLGKSVNDLVGGSLMLGLKKNAWHAKVRYSEKQYGDYRVPTDSIVYQTQRLPIYNGRLKNTAGVERDVNAYLGYESHRYRANYTVSNTYQKNGFFPGAHGIPNASQLKDDGNSRNIDFPFSQVNHFKVTSNQKYMWDDVSAQWDLGYQSNHREEWSRFHTHYSSQSLPETDPDKELVFQLNTLNSSLKVKWFSGSNWEHVAGWDIQYQKNDIAGYSFLLPEFNRLTTGALWLTTYRPSNTFSLSGGVRYDYGKIDISSFADPYLVTYLQQNGYSEEEIEKYKWRSYAVNRTFGDYSCSLGFVWNPSRPHLVKGNVGRSFRLPGANELASNGVHHGTFRHEQGMPTLSSERGWQADASYLYENKGITFSVTPFASWFNNYIFLKPTGEWSILPDAGQIYRYTEVEAVLSGVEASFGIDLTQHLNYQITGEYLYTYNLSENIPLSFSPPASMRNMLTWKGKEYKIHAEVQSIANQNRVSRNEERTAGANLLHLGASTNISLGKTKVELTVSAQNILNTKYYNHLSFYRKVEIPEPGRNIQLFIKVPFKHFIK